MKHGVKPTVKQCKVLEKWGLNPSEWLIVKDTPAEMVIQHRHFERTVKTIHKE